MNEVRLLQPEEIGWALDLAEKCYDRKLGRDAWERWVQNVIAHPNFRIFRGEGSLLVALAQQMLPDMAEIEGLFPYWMCDGPKHTRELTRLFEAALEWMRTMNVSVVWLRPTTGVDASGLAKILGFERAYPTFSTNLKKVH